MNPFCKNLSKKKKYMQIRTIVTYWVNKGAKQYMQKISFSEKCIYMHIKISEEPKQQCQ